MHVIALMLLLNLDGLAQNLNFESVKVKHRSVPQQPLGENIQTYNSFFRPVDLELTNAQLESMKSKNLILNGYAYQEEDADLTIELVVDVLSFNSRDLVDRSTTKKEGETEVKVPAFQYSLTYDYPFKITVTDNTTGTVLLTEEDILPVSYVFPANSTASSTTALANMYEESKAGLINSIRKTGMDKLLSDTRYIVNDQFGYPVIDLDIDMGYVKKFKKYDYSDLYAAFEDMRVGLNQVEEDWYLKPPVDNLNKALAVFSKVKDEYSSGDKKARINEEVVAMIYLNAAMCDFFLKNFSECQQYLAQIGDKAPYKIKSNKKFIDDFMNDVKNRYVANNIDFN
jgi:hypothetical protein